MPRKLCAICAVSRHDLNSTQTINRAFCGRSWKTGSRHGRSANMRDLPEWRGRSDNSRPPQRVELRIYTKQNGVCPICNRVLRAGHWDLDHIKALINGGENREANLQAVCDDPCHSDKTKRDVAEKSKNYRVASKHVGIERPRAKLKSRGFQKASPQHSATRPIERRADQ